MPEINKINPRYQPKNIDASEILDACKETNKVL